jgi:hypothetical protein
MLGQPCCAASRLHALHRDKSAQAETYNPAFFWCTLPSDFHPSCGQNLIDCFWGNAHGTKKHICMHFPGAATRPRSMQCSCFPCPRIVYVAIILFPCIMITYLLCRKERQKAPRDTCLHTYYCMYMHTYIHVFFLRLAKCTDQQQPHAHRNACVCVS